MGVLGRFEKGIERAVNGAFAKAFRSEVQPVEIASALRKEVDDKAAIVGRDRTIVPNDFVVELGKADHGRLEEWQEALGSELTTAVYDYANQQRYAFVGPVHVAFEEAEDLDTGLFRVRSATTGAASAPAAPPAGPAYPNPAGGPAQSAPGLPQAPGYAPGPGAVPSVSAPPLAGAAPAPSPYPPSPYQAEPAPFPGWVQPAPAAASPSAPPVPAAAPGWADPVDAAPQQATPANRPVATLEIDGAVYRVTKPVTVIGRGADVDVPVEDPGVSRRHAEVHLVDGRVRVIDLGSTNGTFVDGERIHAGTLTDGSTITVGRSRIVVHLGQW